ncbi:helix-turn-helix transcriptional regulator [Nocardia sp. NBC_01327]|uniref:helix-turn-helix transcriptional regulator n=1 Tax=Nocardia sp. NBC_01327 TaxID=2903593 RepID=UPI002E15AB2F|nr:LuxR C-terminal-related transcriptional regulator [Nocardia sp. NBC_01327]
MRTPQRSVPLPATQGLGRLPAGPARLTFQPIDRSDLRDRIDIAVADPHTRVLMICAAAGSGKTVLLTDWLRRQVSGADSAWLTVSPASAQSQLLWSTLRTRLAVPEAPRADNAAPLAEAVHLLDALSARQTPVVLVIDDAHLLTDPVAVAGLEYFLTHAPDTVTAIMAGRFDPPVRWHNFELAGQLTRLPAGLLVMSHEQVAQVCRRHLPSLTVDELRTIANLTRGWPALVRISAIHLAGHSRNRVAALTTLARPSQAVSDFLVRELLETLSPELRLFLTYTSIPDSFTEQLADELTGGGAAHRMYELDRANFPLTHELRGDELWFSYHPMLRSYLRGEAHRLGIETRRDLHVRTAAWLRHADQPLAALPHLLAGPGETHLRRFLIDAALELVLEGRGCGLFAALHSLQPDLADDPYIWLLCAMNALLYGDAADALPLLEVARTRQETRVSFVPASWIELLSAATAAGAAVMAGTAVDGITMREPLQYTGNADIDCYATNQLAMAAFVRGDIARGAELLHSALAVAEHSGRARLAVQAITRLATAAGLAGEITAMRERADRALAIAAEYAVPDNPDTTLSLTMSALAAYLQGEWPDPAQVRAALTLHSRQDGSSVPAAGWHAHVLGQLLTFERAADRSAAADVLRHSMLELLDKQAVPMMSSGLVPPVVWALLRVHEPRTARLLVERARRTLGDTADIVIARAALAHAANSPATARDLVRPLIENSETIHPTTATFAWLLYAVSHPEQPLKAREGMENALRIAARDKLVRPFLDVPQAIRLLDALAGQLGRHDVFADFVRRHPKAARSTEHPALTTTEVTVLRLLPSGRTTQHIADDLGVSINNVKTHLRGIYTKLGANTRVDALDRARRTGLI